MVIYLPILRLGAICAAESPRKTKFCGTQPRFRWRKLSRPIEGLRGCVIIGIIGCVASCPPKVIGGELPRRSWSSLLLLMVLLLSWSWLMLIWIARNLKRKKKHIEKSMYNCDSLWLCIKNDNALKELTFSKQSICKIFYTI